MIPKIIGVGLISALVSSILAEMGCKTKKVFVALTVIVMLLGLVAELSGIFSELLSISEVAGVTEVTKAALKIVGLGYVFGISSDVCCELGEKRIAEVLTLFGRTEMLLITFPFIREMVEMGTRLIK